jgi:hypothetical protein
MNCEQRREFREESEGVEGLVEISLISLKSGIPVIALANIEELDICSILHEGDHKEHRQIRGRVKLACALNLGRVRIYFLCKETGIQWPVIRREFSQTSASVPLGNL